MLDINEINNKCPYDQGIFIQPYGIPVNVKEPVVYMRCETGGYRGGGYGNDAKALPYTNNEPEPKFEALDLVLKELKPNITYLEYRGIEKLIHTNRETDQEYYGNSTDYNIKYIVLSDLEKALGCL